MSEQETESDSLSAVASAAARLADIETSRREAADTLAKAMYAAHKLGHTWSQIADSAGLASPHTARTRANSALDLSEMSPSARWRQEQGHAPRPKTEPVGLSVSEAARRKGVSRKTIYSWIETGRVRSTVDEAGRTRVLLTDD